MSVSWIACSPYLIDITVGDLIDITVGDLIDITVGDLIDIMGWVSE